MSVRRAAGERVQAPPRRQRIGQRGLFDTARRFRSRCAGLAECAPDVREGVGRSRQGVLSQRAARSVKAAAARRLARTDAQSVRARDLVWRTGPGNSDLMRASNPPLVALAERAHGRTAGTWPVVCACEATSLAWNASAGSLVAVSRPSSSAASGRTRARGLN